jgi:hypothetical protein
MTISLTDDQVRMLRLRAQRLIPGSQDTADGGVADLVKALCGVQAQDMRAAPLALRVRSTDLIAADVERARVQERTIVRTWGQRSTLHLLAAEDLGWLLSLFGPVFVAANQRRRAELGLDDDTYSRAIRVIRDVLASQGPRTRAELVDQLAHHDISIEGQARPHLLARAALEGIICMGPDRGTEPTYVLLNDWVEIGRTLLSQEGALVELARRYLGTYGPATPEDMAAWSGLSIRQIRAAWRELGDQLIDVQIGGSRAWLPKTRCAWLDEPPAPSFAVHLLPAFDIYLLGYQHRDLVVPRQYAKRVNAGGGILHPTLLVDGCVVATWKGQRKKDSMDLTVEPFDQLSPEIYPALEAETADIARFLGMRTELNIA